MLLILEALLLFMGAPPLLPDLHADPSMQAASDGQFRLARYAQVFGDGTALRHPHTPSMIPPYP
eukprot:3379241-Rhodomonas_salina.1